MWMGGKFHIIRQTCCLDYKKYEEKFKSHEDVKL